MKKFFLKSFIFFTIIGMLFSNVPFYALTSAFDAYIKTLNIVDKSWKLSQKENVVDKFTSYRNLSERVKVHEAYAATSYIANGAFAYSSSGGTSVSPAYPAGVAANDLLVMIIGMKPAAANGGSVTTPAGWTAVTGGSLTGAGGYGTTLGADAGNTNVFSFYKVAAGTESGSLAVTVAGNGTSWAQMYLLRNASGSWSVAGATGSDTSAGNVSIAHSANPGVQAGDFIIGAMVIPTDVSTPSQFSAEAVTQASVTFDTVTEIGEADTNVGNDMGGVTYRTSVSSGTATGNPTFTATAGGTTTNVRGPGVFIRVRETNTAPTLTITQPDGVSDTVTVGASYNITYNLADPDPKHAVTAAMYYDTDATGLNGTAITGACATAAEGTGATCSWDTAGITPGTYYVYGITNDGIAAQVSDYSPGTITINGPSVDATSISYQVGGDGGRSGYSATIAGSGFGTVAGGSRANCAGGAGTGCIRFTAGGNATVADGDITSWTDTSIVFVINANLSSNGGTNNVEVVAAGNADSTKLTFYIYPNITAVASIGTNAGREYAASDTDGLIMLSGDHFGAAGSVTILGSAATQHATAEGSCASGGYGTTAVCLEIPTAIADSTNTGDIVVTRTSDSKTHTFSTLRVLPRITGLSISSGTENDAITINGNHFCQGAGCPTGFDASNNVTFDGTQATTFTSWSATAIATAVPVGATSGNVVVTSNTYASNGEPFTVLSNTPNDPASLDQFKNAGLTQAIATGGYASATPIYLKQVMEVGTSGGTLYPQFEYQLVGTSFVCGAGACASAVEGTGQAGTGPFTGSKSITPADGSYHWQARTRNSKGSNYYSNWISFGGNPEASADFIIDTTGPTFTIGPSSSNVLSNSADIGWTTDVSSTGRVQYNKTGSFGACGTDCTTEDASDFSHTKTLSNLDSGTTYYYRVRAKDAAGNETISSNGTFNTSSVIKPSKTTKFFAMGLSNVALASDATSTDFSIFISESNPSVKSAFVELTGNNLVNGTNNITVQVNGQASKTYVIASNQSPFKIVYKVDASNINTDPTLNTLTVTPDQDAYIASAKITITYAYTP